MSVRSSRRSQQSLRVRRSVRFARCFQNRLGPRLPSLHTRPRRSPSISKTNHGMIHSGIRWAYQGVRRACPARQGRSPAGFEELDLEYSLNTLLDLPPAKAGGTPPASSSLSTGPSPVHVPGNPGPLANIEPPAVHLVITTRPNRRAALRAGQFRLDQLSLPYCQEYRGP